ncbi:MAG: hypothetical protein AAB683_01730, partial [Patescibacteria group bacterium]
MKILINKNYIISIISVVLILCIFIPISTNAQTTGTAATTAGAAVLNAASKAITLTPPPVVTASTIILNGATKSFINSVLANIADGIMSLVGSLLSITGVFLNLAITTTLRIGEYQSKITAIGEIWIVIRNISSIFIIFLLIFYSIKTMLSVGTSNLKSLITNVIVAGLLINFSLFFARTMIDASNLVSMQFYRAMAPDTENNTTVPSAYTSGGISNVF